MIAMMTTMLQSNSNDVFWLFRNLQSYYHLYFQIFLQKGLTIFIGIFSSRVYPDHKFQQIITLHEDWNDGYNVSVRLKWRIWCFPKATIPLLSFFWNFFLKEFICIPAQILEPGIYPDHKSSQKMILEPGIPRIPGSQVPTNNNSAWGSEWWL